MLSDRIPQWIREGEQRGKAVGESIGEAKTLLKLLNLKFGHLPDRVEQQVNSAGKDQLDLWVGQVLTAQSIGDMFSENQ